jgi:transcriptional regulator with XRE-family HTH domain
MSFSRRLKQFRESANLSQREVARRISQLPAAWSNAFTELMQELAVTPEERVMTDPEAKTNMTNTGLEKRAAGAGGRHRFDLVGFSLGAAVSPQVLPLPNMRSMQ